MLPKGRNMKSRSRGRLISIVVGVLTFVITTSAFFSLAQPELPSDTLALPAERLLIGAIQLQPLLDTDVLIPDMKAEFLSEGSVTISGSGIYEVDGPPLAYQFEVDLVKGTYTTRLLDPSQLEKQVPQKRRFKNRAPLDVGPLAQFDVNPSVIPASWVYDGSNPFPLGYLRREIAHRPGRWWGSVSVFTRDPPQLILTQTYSKLDWTVYSNGTVNWNYYDDSCWAANPSSVGTHWFVRSCWYGSVWRTNGNTQVCHNHDGSYYNYDFGNPGLRTDVYQWTQICGRNDGYFNYWWNHTDSGEYSSLIYGFIVLNQG